MHQADQHFAQEINLFELVEAVGVFGINETKKVLAREVTKVRDLIAISSSITPDKFVTELHKACGRLSLLGAHSPRYLSREIRAEVMDTGRNLSSTGLKEKMLDAVTAAESELADRLESIVPAEDEQTAGFAAVGLIFLALFSYAGAVVGFLATFTLSGAATGFCAAFVATTTLAVTVRLRNELR